MIYIVTGLMRTGTSLMMQILREAGIPPFYSKAYERRGKGGRLRNVAFLEVRECIRGDISKVPDGHCVKVFLNMMPKIDLTEEKYKVIAMWRPTIDRMRSMRQGMPYKQWVEYREKSTHANEEVEGCYDDLKQQFPSHIVVDFNELFDAPKSVLSRVSQYVELPKVVKARSVIRLKSRHYHKGARDT